MRTAIISILSLLVITGFLCSTDTFHYRASSGTKKIILNTFSIHDIPDSLLGAGCIYSASEQEFKQKRYILSFQMGTPDYAIISANHKLNFLHIASDSLIVYANETYTVTVQTKDGKYSGETWESTGSMKVKDKSGDSTIVNLYGECGD